VQAERKCRQYTQSLIGRVAGDRETQAESSAGPFQACTPVSVNSECRPRIHPENEPRVRQAYERKLLQKRQAGVHSCGSAAGVKRLVHPGEIMAVSRSMHLTCSETQKRK